MSVISERLSDALEKGDVAELEVAITAAQAALEENVYRSGPRGATSGKMATLLAKAKDTFLVNLEACKSYLKPLRKACRHLDERAIFDSLVLTQSAPEYIQLYMYTDIRRAEELREAIVSARDKAFLLLNSDDWQSIDAFLNDKASVLEDRTVLALVQKREDLLKGGFGGRSQATLSDRGVSAPGRSGGKPWGDVAARDVSAISSSSNFLARHESDSDAVDLGASPVDDPYKHDASWATSGRRGILKDPAAGTFSARPAWRALTPPAPNTHAASGSIVTTSYSLRPIIAEESDGRAEVAALETRDRVKLFKEILCSAAASQASTNYGQCADDDNCGEETSDIGTADSETGNPRAPLRTGPAKVAHRGTPSHLNSDRDADENEPFPEPRSAPPPRASFSPLEREDTQKRPSRLPLSSAFFTSGPEQGESDGKRRSRTPTRSRLNRVVNSEATQHSSSATEGGKQNTWPHRRHFGPDKDGRGSEADGSLANFPKDNCLHTGGGRGGPRDHMTPDLSPIKANHSTLPSGRGFGGETPASRAVVTALSRHNRSDGGVIRPPPDVNETAVSPDQNARRSGTLSTASASSAATPRSYELRRLDILLRGLQEEEELRRRDTEGTEDFDRCVFLYPMAARIDMLKRSLKERQRIINQ